MRELIERLERVIGEGEASVKVSFPEALYSELYALEVEAHGGVGVGDGAADFVKSMESAKKTGKGYALVFSPDAIEYMKSSRGPLRQHLDIWDDRWEDERDATSKKAMQAAKRIYKKLASQRTKKPLVVRVANSSS